MAKHSRGMNYKDTLMVRDDGRRNFALRENGEETSTFSGNTPRQAALKAARRLEPEDNEDEALDNTTEIRLREKGTDKIHVYQGWAWMEEAPDDAPEYLGDMVTSANVSKEGVEYEE